MPFIDIAAIVGAAFISTLIAVVWILRHQPDQTSNDAGSSAENAQLVSMLFENGVLQHASDGANKLYQLIPDQEDWESIRHKLGNRFPKLPEKPEMAPPGTSTIAARHMEDSAAIRLTREGNYLRLNMLDEQSQIAANTKLLRDQKAELDHLRRASETTPHAIWQVDSNGLVVWHNAAYADLYQRLHQRDPDETKPVFEMSSQFEASTERQRVATQPQDQEYKDWYDISAFSVGDITIFHAVDVNAVVKSEVAQRNFVQTLAKTFAQLPIGLAIFDRNGQLALFNPALIDLTELPADFLSGRPTLMSFFDRIRENRRMPEPKNYHSWRQQIAEVIAAATDGRYQETWTLETGQTYRVKGRPHPDGAIAFLIEDISAEISLTRNFRAELELGQSLMDTFDDALAVFSSAGVLTFSNLAYRTLWGLDPENSFADVTVTDSVREWKGLCKPGARWAALTDFVLDYGEKTSWEMPVTLTSGDRLACAVSRIASGATVVRFTRKQEAAPTGRKSVPKPGSV